MEDERLVVSDLDELSEVFLRLFDVDEGEARVVEDAEEAVDAHVDAGRLQQHLAIPGLNAIELDVKDVNGHVGPGTYYKSSRVARVVHAHGIYLIGRVVTFEDPVLSENQPALAIHNSDGTIWHNNAGLGWTNPYDRRVWAYNVTVAVAAAKAGFDEIQFDYVR